MPGALPDAVAIAVAETQALLSRSQQPGRGKRAQSPQAHMLCVKRGKTKCYGNLACVLV